MMHAGMIPHQAWRTQTRQTTERQTAEREGGRKDRGVFWQIRVHQGKDEVWEEGGIKIRIPPCVSSLPQPGETDRHPYLSPALCTRHGLFSITAAASCTTSRRALESLSPPLSRQLLLLCSAAGASHLRTSHSGCVADTICPGLPETLTEMTQIWASAR